jgi:diguanylate cyclase (GGDEF)-like protein
MARRSPSSPAPESSATPAPALDPARGGPPAAGRPGELLEAVSRIQGMVSRREPLALVYQAVVDGAGELLGADSGSLRFVDPDDPRWMIAVAARGETGRGERWRQRAPVTEGVSGRVITSGELVAIEDYERARLASQLAPNGTQAVMGVPLRDRNGVVGCLVAGSTVRGRRWRREDRELLSSYGEHVAVALAVARAGDAVHQAFTDPLTGLPNRAWLLDRLTHELVRADRGGAPPTVLFLDLDRFKIVNDSLGHAVGDGLLLAVGERLRSCVRGGDTCARVGGDEFAVLLGSGVDAELVAERIIDTLQRRFEISGHELFIDVSVGIASGSADAEALLRNADVAMYEAKRRGGGRHLRFEPGMHGALVARLDLDAELRRALERGELELRYQPIVDLRSGAITAFEALLFWRHPRRGLLARDEFLPLAEEIGLRPEIGRWALHAACAQLAAWRGAQAPGSPLAVSIDVSLGELEAPGFAAGVEEAIGGAFPPSALMLALTDTRALADATSAREALRALRQRGTRVALGDFGRGSPSLLDLTRLPVDVLGIAPPFVEAIGPDGHDASGVLGAIVALGRHLGMTTVATGIERPEQRAHLVEVGCELGQGYLFGRPLDAVAAGALVAPRSAV